MVFFKINFFSRPLNRCNYAFLLLILRVIASFNYFRGRMSSQIWRGKTGLVRDLTWNIMFVAVILVKDENVQLADSDICPQIFEWTADIWPCDEWPQCQSYGRKIALGGKYSDSFVVLKICGLAASLTGLEIWGSEFSSARATGNLHLHEPPKSRSQGHSITLREAVRPDLQQKPYAFWSKRWNWNRWL